MPNLEYILSVNARVSQPEATVPLGQGPSTSIINQVTHSQDDLTIGNFQYNPAFTVAPGGIYVVVPLGTLTNIKHLFLQPYLPPTAPATQIAKLNVRINGIALPQPTAFLLQDLADVPATLLEVANPDPSNPVLLQYLLSGT